ncbi:hypothetical protein J6590_030427 [Homalodisca vitripennis]|nr:hypothetical protein J6590_030427 [Homalodisca vitripennis]
MQRRGKPAGLSCNAWGLREGELLMAVVVFSQLETKIIILAADKTTFWRSQSWSRRVNKRRGEARADDADCIIYGIDVSTVPSLFCGLAEVGVSEGPLFVLSTQTHVANISPHLMLPTEHVLPSRDPTAKSGTTLPLRNLRNPNLLVGHKLTRYTEPLFRARCVIRQSGRDVWCARVSSAVCRGPLINELKVLMSDCSAACGQVSALQLPHLPHLSPLRPV